MVTLRTGYEELSNQLFGSWYAGICFEVDLKNSDVKILRSSACSEIRLHLSVLFCEMINQLHLSNSDIRFLVRSISDPSRVLELSQQK